MMTGAMVLLLWGPHCAASLDLSAYVVPALSLSAFLTLATLFSFSFLIFFLLFLDLLSILYCVHVGLSFLR